MCVSTWSRRRGATTRSSSTCRSTWSSFVRSSADAIVVGAGPAGLAAAAELERRGLTALVLERGDGPGAAWAQHYDRLALNTVRWTAGLPGHRLPRRAGRWPARDAVHAYLSDYRARRCLAVRSGVTVQAVTANPSGGWDV